MLWCTAHRNISEDFQCSLPGLKEQEPAERTCEKIREHPDERQPGGARLWLHPDARPVRDVLPDTRLLLRLTAAYSCDMTSYFFWRAKYLFLSLLALPKHLPYTHN